MSPNTISDELVKILLDKMEKMHISMDGNGYIDFSLTIDELLRLSSEDRAFLSKYVDEYRRGHFKLRPKSFTQFLTDRKKYSGDDEAYFSLMLTDLMKEGLLRKVEIGGFTYWEFAGMVLDPMRFVNMYKADEDVFRTLFKEWGFLEIYEKFKDAVSAGRLNRSYDSSCLVEFKYDKATLIIGKEWIRASAWVGYELKEPIYNYHNGSIMTNNVFLWIRVSNPRPEDVYKILAYVDYTDFLVKEIFDNMKRVVKDATGMDVDISGLDGNVDVENYKLERANLTAKVRVYQGRSTLTLTLGVKFDRNDYEYRDGRKISLPIMRTQVEAEGAIKSLYVHDLMQVKDEGISLPDDITVRLDHDNKEVSVKVSRSVPTITYVDAGKPYEMAKRFKEVLSMVAEKKLKALMDKDPVVKYRDKHYGREEELGKVKEMVDGIKWFEVKDFDEAVLKLIALKIAHLGKIEAAEAPILDYLIGHAVLKGYDQDTLTKRINDPLETVIEFVEEGKLKAMVEGGKPQIYFKGKPLENYISDPSISYNLKRLVWTAFALMKPDESLRLRKRVPS